MNQEPATEEPDPAAGESAPAGESVPAGESAPADDTTVEEIMAKYYDELDKSEGDYRNNLIKDAIVRIAQLYYSHKGKYKFSSANMARKAPLSDPGKKNMEDTMLALWILALYQLNDTSSVETMKQGFGNFNAMKYDVTKPHIRFKSDGKILGPFMTYIGEQQKFKGKGYGGIWFSNSDEKHIDKTLKRSFTDVNITKAIEKEGEEGWIKRLETHGAKIKGDAAKMDLCLCAGVSKKDEENDTSIRRSATIGGGRKHKKTLKRKSKKGKKTMKKKGKKSKKKVGKKNKKTMKKKKGKKSKKSKRR